MSLIPNLGMEIENWYLHVYPGSALAQLVLAQLAFVRPALVRLALASLSRIILLVFSPVAGCDLGGPAV